MTFYSWASQLLVLIVLLILASAAAPSDSWKPFIRLIAGLFFLLWLITPVKSLMDESEHHLIMHNFFNTAWLKSERERGEQIIDGMNDKRDTYLLEQAEEALRGQAQEALETDCECRVEAVRLNDGSNVHIYIKGGFESGRNLKERLAALWEMENDQIIYHINEQPGRE
ncbi:stage III sporulation protein AF [Jeotgalibacillus aurantiacus]|uniref:stage III sporulation protein AF n=1 Tax=Jeotgalibacillus aurantiacus TaxID=2763266 RepID=UPI001D0B1E3C|nr:stage III sporulation protein AF [Jeotgalibacillus aurantiacus]